MSSLHSSVENSALDASRFVAPAATVSEPLRVNLGNNAHVATSHLGLRQFANSPAEQRALWRFFIDTLIVITSSAVVSWMHLRAVANGSTNFNLVRPQLGALALYATLTLLICFCLGLYKAQFLLNWRPHLERAATAVFIATAIFLTYIWLSGVHSGMTRAVLYMGVMNGSSFVAWRSIRAKQVELQSEKGEGHRNILILGAGEIGRDLARSLRNQSLGLSVVGFLDKEPSTTETILGGLDDLTDVVKSHFVNEVIIAPPWDADTLRRVMAAAENFHLDVGLVPELDRSLALNSRIDYLGDLPLVSIREEPIPEFSLVIKRTFDILCSSILLALLFPFLLLIGLVIRFDSDGPILYRSYRLGKKGRQFSFYKFRTMIPGADAIKSDLRCRNQRNGPFFKISDDPRVTRFGTFLRKYSIDELPQLWNVLKGDMSLVGPRPHPLDDCSFYTLDHLRRLTVTPGITGLWQVDARNDSSFEVSMSLDLEYIETWSLWLDLKIMLKTIPVVLKASGQ